jgi:voltage-gated potassium channel
MLQFGGMQHRLTAFLRRFYLAAADLHPGILVLLLFVHMLASYALLLVTREVDLTPVVPFIYWYATTASTVGYGDLSPKSDAGRMVSAFFVMPGAIAIFTTAIARSFAGIAEVVQRRQRGMGDYEELTGAVILVGYDAARTPQMVDEIFADRGFGGAPMVLVTTEELGDSDPRYRYVRARSLTAPAELARAGVTSATRVIVFGANDAETLASALAVTALNAAGHIVCFFDDSDTARLLEAHCPRVEVVLTPAVELVVKALSDPGSSRFLMQLASHTDAGATLYTMVAARSDSFTAAAARLREADAILVAHCSACETQPRFELDGQVEAGDRLFYIARRRIAY